MTRATTNRRMGPVGSTNWHAILDAAEMTLLEEGYGALTSRRIAERVGIKQRLVYYYFQTMDEVIVETFRRLSARELERMSASTQAETPIRELWNVCIHTTDSRITSEFMALAFRSDGLRDEVINFIQEARRIQAQAVRRVLVQMGISAALDADGIALLATGMALTMTREATLGITTGHASLLTWIEAFQEKLEPAD